MTSILKADTIQDTDGNNIINENSNTITIGASGDTTNIIGTLQNNGSAVGGTNTPHFEAYRSGSQAVSDNTWTTVVFNAESRDASSVYDTSNGRFTPTTAGKYFCYAIVIGGNDGADSLNYVLAKFFKNGSDYQTTSVNKLDFRNNPGANGQVATFSVIEFNGSSDYLEVKTQISTGAHPDVVESSVFGAYKIIE
jgi:hypothetical protein